MYMLILFTGTKLWLMKDDGFLLRNGYVNRGGLENKEGHIVIM